MPLHRTLADILKLTFDEQATFQRMLGAVEDQSRAQDEVERSTGVALHVRGNEVTLEGEPDAIALVERLLRQMYTLAKAGKPMEAADLGRAVEALRADPRADLRTVFDDVILTPSVPGKVIAPRSLAQKRYVEAIRRHSLCFAVGPAGTGKTFLAVALAVKMLLERHIRRIVLVRPAIEAGENLGFLPGTLEDKISPFLRPLYDALNDMLDGAKVQRMFEHGAIEVAPLAYMRGRTLNDSFVILDEAQNTTREQMKMFLTRMGTATRMVVTGDPSQVDLPVEQKSGLAHALRLLKGVEGIAVCTFTPVDVMRHPLVQEIVCAYERDSEARARARAAGAHGGPATGSGGG